MYEEAKKVIEEIQSRRAEQISDLDQQIEQLQRNYLDSGCRSDWHDDILKAEAERQKMDLQRISYSDYREALEAVKACYSKYDQKAVKAFTSGADQILQGLEALRKARRAGDAIIDEIAGDLLYSPGYTEAEKEREFERCKLPDAVLGYGLLFEKVFSEYTQSIKGELNHV